MTYRDAVRWLDARVNYERSGASLRWQRMRNLDRIRRLLEALGDPHRPGSRRASPGPGTPGPKPLYVHIAGTKGKGSTAHLFADALRALGLRTGLYTSPHLTDLCERIRVDGVPIRPARLAAHLTRIRRTLRSPALRRDPPTYFDLLTAAAFLEFRDRRLDAAVVETGLGGRLDSTNVVAPALTVITNVDYDHTDVLGATLAAIAREKAGIAKPGVPLVRGALSPEAARVVSRAARRAGAPAWSAGRELRLGRVVPRGLAGIRFDARTPRRLWRAVRLAVPGRHQAENALLVLGGLDRLEADGWIRVRPGRVRSALAHTRIPGRLEVRPGRPVLIVDAAHNPRAGRTAGGRGGAPRPALRGGTGEGCPGDAGSAGRGHGCRRDGARRPPAPADAPGPAGGGAGALAGAAGGRSLPGRGPPPGPGARGAGRECAGDRLVLPGGADREVRGDPCAEAFRGRSRERRAWRLSVDALSTP